MYPTIAIVKEPEPIPTGPEPNLVLHPGEPTIRLQIDPELATYLVRRLPHPDSPDLESFAAVESSRPAQKEPTTEEQRADFERRLAQRAAGINPDGAKPVRAAAAATAALAEMQCETEMREAARTSSLRKKDGSPVNEPLLISTRAYASLSNHFSQLSSRMNDVWQQLHDQPALVYKTPDTRQPGQQSPRP